MTKRATSEFGAPRYASRPHRGIHLGATTLVALAASSVSRHAEAAFEYRLFATGSATWTDNLNNAPDEVDPDSESSVTKESGFLFALNPGAALSLIEPRGQLDLTYTRPMTVTTSDSVPPSTSDALTASGNYQATETDTVGGAVTVTRSSMTALLFSGTNPGAVSGINNAGTEEVWRAQISEFWTREWTETLSMQQTSSYGTQLSFDDGDLPNTRIVTNSLGLRLDHRWGAFTLLGTETASEPPDGNGDWVHLITGLLGWSRELDALTTLGLQVGVAKALTDTPPQVIGGASLSQTRELMTWSVSLLRSQAGDLQTGRIFTTESAIATLNFSSFETTPISLTAGGGASRFGDEVTTAYNAQAFASINYAHDYFVSSLSYNYLQQIVSEDRAEEQSIPSLSRHAVTLTVGGVFPPQE